MDISINIKDLRILNYIYKTEVDADDYEKKNNTKESNYLLLSFFYNKIKENMKTWFMKRKTTDEFKKEIENLLG